jgi:hypothetical protein
MKILTDKETTLHDIIARALLRIVLLAILITLFYSAIAGIAGVSIMQNNSRVSGSPTVPLMFATYAEDNSVLYWNYIMGESIRTFGGQMKEAPVRVYLSSTCQDWDEGTLALLKSMRMDVRFVDIPTEHSWYPYASKVFASSHAESDAKHEAALVAWLDPDMVFVREPREFLLKDEFDIGYRPVQLVNISSLYDQPIDDFWERVYSMVGVPDSALFSMITTVDNTAIRPHFNAGMIIVRPAKGILQSWAENFGRLASDSVITDLCGNSSQRKIYLHQAALTATLLTNVSHDRMCDLPPTYNYAVFLTEKMADKKTIMALDDVVMFRHGQHYISIDKLEEYAGSSKIFRWLKEKWRN